MATSPQLYSRAKVYVNSTLLAEESSVTVNRQTQSSPVYSTATGYGGETPGSPLIELTVESNIPNAGFDLEPSNFNELGFVEVVVELDNGRILPFEVVIYSDNFQHAVNSNATFSLSARGKAVSWE